MHASVLLVTLQYSDVGSVKLVRPAFTGEVCKTHFVFTPSWVSLRIPRAVPSILWDAYSVRGNFSTMSGKWQGIAMKETNCESSWIENLHSLFWQRRRIQFVGQGRMIWRPSRISV